MAQRQTTNGPSDLRLGFAGRRVSGSLLEIDAWIPGEITAIAPLVDRLMRLIEGSRCIAGNEPAVGIARREALNNAVVHGNGVDARKLVHVVKSARVSDALRQNKTKGLVPPETRRVRSRMQ